MAWGWAPQLFHLHQQERHLDFHPSCLPSQQQSSAPHLLEAKDLAKVHLVGVNALANKDKTTALGSQPKHSFELEHRMPLVGCVPFALDLLLDVRRCFFGQPCWFGRLVIALGSRLRLAWWLRSLLGTH